MRHVCLLIAAGAVLLLTPLSGHGQPMTEETFLNKALAETRESEDERGGKYLWLAAVFVVGYLGIFLLYRYRQQPRRKS